MIFRPEADRSAVETSSGFKDWVIPAVLLVAGYLVLYAVLSIPQ